MTINVSIIKPFWVCMNLLQKENKKEKKKKNWNPIPQEKQE